MEFASLRNLLIAARTLQCLPRHRSSRPTLTVQRKAQDTTERREDKPRGRPQENRENTKGTTTNAQEKLWAFAGKSSTSLSRPPHVLNSELSQPVVETVDEDVEMKPVALYAAGKTRLAGTEHEFRLIGANLTREEQTHHSNGASHVKREHAINRSRRW